MENIFQKIFNDFSQNENYSGVCLIKSKNEILFSNACGYASRAFLVPNNINIRFDVASITKIFTAAAILSLVEQGALKLNDKIADIIDLSGTQIPKDIEIQHLLSHTSGIADDAEEENGESYSDLFIKNPNYAIRSCKDFLPNFVYKKPNFKAGTDIKYNNCAFILLGLAIENIVGTDCRNFMTSHIFEPCGMSNTKFCAMDEINENTAEGYASIKDENGGIIGWKKNIYSYPPIGTPDGGVYTTCEDLDKFTRAISSYKILTKEYADMLLSPQNQFKRNSYWSIAPNTYIRYGFAFEFIEIEGSIFSIYKDGCNDGVAAIHAYYPQANITVSILANQDCNVWKMHREMQTEIYNGFYTDLSFKL